MTNSDPYLVAAFPLANRLRRLVWGVVWAALFRTSPRPCHAWRRMLLRVFGARVGADFHVHPRTRIWAPWNLETARHATLAEDVVVYNPAPLKMGLHAIVSQGAYLCGATHDYESPAFPLVSFPTTLGDYSWVCARAVVQPGVSLGEGAVLALGSVATRNLEPWTVYGGVPARQIKRRVLRQEGEHEQV